MIGNIFWLTAMVGLVIAVIVAGVREKKAQAKARKALAPQPLDIDGLDEPISEGFGESDPVDSFGSDEGDYAAFDEEAFK